MKAETKRVLLTIGRLGQENLASENWRLTGAMLN